MNNAVTVHHGDHAQDVTLPEGYSTETEALAVSLARAEVDQQITTAHAYPRQIKRAVNNILSLATLDEDTAKECVYALVRAGKAIRGPSVRLAEIIASQWGNCRVGTRVVHVDRFEKFIEAEGVFHDLETNAAVTARVRRRISDKQGRLFSEDMIIVTGNAACAIAKRNAILGAVPKAVWRKAHMAVESTIAGDIKTLTERREGALKAFAAFGVAAERVLAAIERKSVEEVTVEDLPNLVGMYSAIRNGEATVEEVFPPIAPPSGNGNGKTLQDKFDNIAGEKKAENREETHDPETGEVNDQGKGPEQAAQEPKEPKRGRPAGSKNKPKEPAQAAAPGAGEGQPQQEPGQPGQPTTEAKISTSVEYVAHAKAWIAFVTEPTAAFHKWESEKKLRNAVNLDPEVREALLELLKERLAKFAEPQPQPQPQAQQAQAPTPEQAATQPQEQAGKPRPGSTNSIEAARNAGGQAFMIGYPRVIPSDYTGVEYLHEAQAWCAGYDYARGNEAQG